MMRDNRGQALALVMVLTAFILAMGVASLSLATSLRRNTGLEICKKKAYYTAEAGIEKTLALIKTGELQLDQLAALEPGQEINLVPDQISSEYAEGMIEHVRVSGERSGEAKVFTIFIKSSGACQGASCALQAAICANSLNFGNDTGEPPEYVDMDLSSYRRGADRFIEESQQWQGSLYLAELIFIDGDLEIGGSYTGKGIIVVDGSVAITGDLLPDGQHDSLCIMATQPVVIAAGTQAAVLLYGQDQVSLGEGASLRGSVITPLLQLGEGAEFIYQGSLIEQFPAFHFVTFRILSWERDYQ